MAYRSEIERALDEMISDETGMRFQGLAVIHAQQKWPQLVACERKKDTFATSHISDAVAQIATRPVRCYSRHGGRRYGRVGLRCCTGATPA